MSSISKRLSSLEAEQWDFSPAVLQAQHAPPSPLPRLILYTMLALFAVLLVWATFGRPDIVAVAQGKLVPETFLKVVQPSEGPANRGVLQTGSDQRNVQIW